MKLVHSFITLQVSKLVILIKYPKSLAELQQPNGNHSANDVLNLHVSCNGGKVCTLRQFQVSCSSQFLENPRVVDN